MLNIINNKINFYKVISFLSLIIIFWSFFKVIKSLYIIIISVFKDNLYNYDNLVFLKHTISGTHGSLLMAPIFLGIIIIFIKKIKLWHIAFSLIMSFSFEAYQFFDNILHPFLASLHMFDIFLRKGQLIVNPQYTKILFYLIIIIILYFQIIIKKFKTVDKIFLALIITVLFTTTIIFHIAIPMGFFKIAKKELENNLIERVIFQNKKLLCENKICFNLSSDFKLLDKNSKNKDFFYKYNFFINPAANIMIAKKINFYSISLGELNGQGFTYITTVLQKTNEGYFLVYDLNSSKNISLHSEIWFSFLSTMAHLFWFYGGILILFLHKEIMFKKLSPRFVK